MKDVIYQIIEVYGKNYLLCIVFFFGLELFVFNRIRNSRPDYIAKVRVVCLVIAFGLSLMLNVKAFSRADYRGKVFSKDSPCSLETLLDEKNVSDMGEYGQDIYRFHYEKEHGDIDLIDWNDSSIVCQKDFSRYFGQTMICAFIFFIGFMLLKTVCFCDKLSILTFLCAPIGTSIVVSSVVLLICIGAPIKSYTILPLLFCITVALFFYGRNKKVSYSPKDILVVIIGFLASAVASVMCWFKFGGDCQVQLVNAILLVKGLPSFDFTLTSIFGFYGTALHALAYSLGQDYLYAIFILNSVSGVLLLIAAFFDSKTNMPKEKKIMIILSILVMILNFDFDAFCVMMLSNSAISVFIFIIVFLTCDDKDIKYIDVLIALASAVIIVTRVEGVCYVALLLSIPFKRVNRLKKSNLWVGSEIIVWQIIQALKYTSSTPEYNWTPEKGVGLAMVGVLLIWLPWISNLENSFITFLTKYYSFVYIAALGVVIILGVYLHQDFAINTTNIFVSHMGVSKYSNSLVFWCYLLMLLPILFCGDSFWKMEELVYIVCYYLLVYGIAVFREGNDFHVQLGDSMRRIMFQGMLMTTYIICKCYLKKGQICMVRSNKEKT